VYKNISNSKVLCFLVQVKRKRRVRERKKQNWRKLVFLLLFAEQCIVGGKSTMLKIRRKKMIEIKENMNCLQGEDIETSV